MDVLGVESILRLLVVLDLVLVGTWAQGEVGIHLVQLDLGG